MAVAFEDLDRESFENMGYWETVQGCPRPLREGTESLTKTQLATLVMIDNASTSGFGQIRDYNGRTSYTGVYQPTESVATTLDEKGYARVKDRKQVARRTGRGPTGFETKQEGGFVNCYQSDNFLDTVAEKLGFENRFDDGFEEFMAGIMKQHPNA